MDGLTLSQNSVRHMSGWEHAYDRLNLSEVSLESSEFSTRTQNDVTGIAPNLLINTSEPCPIPSLISSPADQVDMASYKAQWGPDRFNDGRPEPFASRKSRRKRFGAPQAKSSMPETDKQRAMVLAKNRMAANRYRLRQKEYVKNLEQQCKKEVEQRRVKNSLVKSLQQEILRLKEEIVRRSDLCDCMHLRGQLDIRDRVCAQLIG
jgi:hypothetical protein